jgi:hypothetical protein
MNVNGENHKTKKRRFEGNNDGEYDDECDIACFVGDVNNEDDMYYILDGGATKSQTNNIRHLDNVKPSNRKVRVANNQYLITHSSGDIGHIRNISYTPGITNLLSELQLIQQGYGIMKTQAEYADIICRTTNKKEELSLTETDFGQSTLEV